MEETENWQGKLIGRRFYRVSNNVMALFSYHAGQQYLDLNGAIFRALFLPEPSVPKQREQINQQLFLAHKAALIAFYRDMGIPTGCLSRLQESIHTPTIDDVFKIRVTQEYFTVFHAVPLKSDFSAIYALLTYWDGSQGCTSRTQRK